MKEVFAPHLNRTVKFGRRHPVAFGPHLKAKNYLMAALPPSPSTADYTAKAAPILSDVMGNDQYGDCVFACGYHLVGTETANAGDAFHATLQQVLADYSKVTGFNPNDPSTDNGANIQDALNYWSSHGFADNTKILGYLGVDATNVSEVQACIYLFENLILGMALPDAWISPFPSGNGFTWDVAGAPDQNNGHCVGAFGYNAKGVTIATWGLLGTLTYKALAEYATSQGSGELWVAITQDQLSRGATKAPNGVDWASLIADFDSIGGHVPVPQPPPVQPPAPPRGGVSLAQAEAAVKKAFAGQPWLMSSSGAVRTALKALESLTGWPT